ncbi:Aste57867_2631 [Aphanomyces stellatus]|uniref:Aste57867_2631 protein n=1 Tax=Aphanomyces stellatus TaxID=120398 RepID=A0A485K940_9STRA|nr:hypothetical protein As57867_002624 [Aphanomyces stellatus]VFT79827.1 Aste57867_2631 [Aphanomyces stellatus]
MLSAETFKNLNWVAIAAVGAYHVFALAAIPRIWTCKWQTHVCAIVFYQLGGLGVTAGIHRLWSHRSYKASDPVRFFLILCSAIANQGTTFHWARDHRVHHKFTDTDADPTNAKRGLFFAHIGWLFVKKHPKVIEAGKQLNVDDLLQDWCIQLENYCHPFGQIFMCLIVPMLLCHFGWGESLSNGLLVPGFLRCVLGLHATWCINSVAHAPIFGYTPYDAGISATDNFWVSLGILGEGWHNWHHAFPYDYAASEYGIASQWNPAKLFIDACAYVGLVTGRKRALAAWEARKKAKSTTTTTATVAKGLPAASEPPKARATRVA